MELISVIIPVFKVEKYLEYCIESIRNQTYKHLEIILVDDGSPDACPGICDKYASIDSRIRVLHKKNGGLSDARNAGLRVAKGSYVSFIDSDDWVELDFFEKLIKESKVNNADIVASNVVMIWENGHSQYLIKPNNCILDNYQAYRSIIIEDKLKQPVWYKLYKRNVIKDFFPKGKIHEDVYWSYQTIANANRVSIISSTNYYYRQRENSIMFATYSKRNIDEIEAQVNRILFTKRHYPNLYNEACVSFMFSLLNHGKKTIKFLTKEEKENTIVYLKELYHMYFPPRKTRKLLKITHKLWLVLGFYNFKLCCKVRELLKIG